MLDQREPQAARAAGDQRERWGGHGVRGAGALTPGRIEMYTRVHIHEPETSSR
jgi:hypothetical protein